MKMSAMVLDYIEEHYNIRRLDNRYRVVVTQRAQMSGWYGYVSVERLDRDHWVHVTNARRAFRSHDQALAVAQAYYDEWEPEERLIRAGVDE